MEEIMVEGMTVEVLATEDRRPQASHETIARATRAHELYLACREALCRIPGSELMSAAESSEEAAFYAAIADFFLQARQKELVSRNAF